jgi:hypothetical protein
MSGHPAGSKRGAAPAGQSLRNTDEGTFGTQSGKLIPGCGTTCAAVAAPAGSPSHRDRTWDDLSEAWIGQRPLDG